MIVIKREGQTVHRFDNGYGASVLCLPGSYGYQQGLFELAVLSFYEDDYEINYNTPITDDVLGWLTQEDVDRYLEKIEGL